jgi:hypothetical protein
MSTHGDCECLFLERFIFQGYSSDDDTNVQEQTLTAPAFWTVRCLGGVSLRHFVSANHSIQSK